MEAHEPSAEGRGGSSDPSQNRIGLATSATVHCLAGCGLGEVLGVVIGVGIGLTAVATIVLAVISASSSGLRWVSFRCCEGDFLGRGPSAKCSSPRA